MRKFIIALGLTALCLASCTQYVLLPPFWMGNDESFSGDAWSGESDTSWYNPGATFYAISTAEQIAGLAEIINDGAEDFKGVVFNLSQDIDLNGINWTPIGDEYTGTENPYNQEDTLFKGFKGTFNGNGHTIYNLTIERQTYNDNRIHYSDSFLGFFGNLEAGVRDGTKQPTVAGTFSHETGRDLKPESRRHDQPTVNQFSYLFSCPSL